MVETQWRIGEWCKCFNESFIFHDDLIFCQNCKNPISCEFCEDYNFATNNYEGLFTCDDHKRDAIKQVLQWE